jgi:tetratricopeptide (TPR) repeat protein
MRAKTRRSERRRNVQAGAPASAVHQLPADVTDFAGRAAQVEALLGVLSAPGGRVAISAIDGMGGLGKTTLAVHVAHRLTGRYPDGQIVVDMAGTGAAPLDPAQALARIIREFAPLMQLPDVVTELRPIYLSLLQGRRVLVILDNAVDGDQVAPLVPPENCALIVTARRRIAVAGVVRVDLDLLAPAEATGLLRSIIGEARADEAERARIAELCGFLPLALRVAGMFLVANPQWTAAEFIGALADQRQRRGLLQLEGSAALDVAASLALSVAELRRARPDIADRWHELAVFPDSFDTAAAAAVWQQSEAAARHGLGMLLSRNMVLYDQAQQRWRLHDLMRDLAGGLVAAESLGAPADLATRIASARKRHAARYCGVLAEANKLYVEGGERLGLALFDRERRNIETGQDWTADYARSDPAAATLSIKFVLGWRLFRARGLNEDQLRQMRDTLPLEGVFSDPLERAEVMFGAANLSAEIRDLKEAKDFCDSSVELAVRYNSPKLGEFLAYHGVLCHQMGDYRAAQISYLRAWHVARKRKDTADLARDLNALGNARLAQRRYKNAAYWYRWTCARIHGPRRLEAISLNNLGLTSRLLGKYDEALGHYSRSLGVSSEIKLDREKSRSLHEMGSVHRDQGNLALSLELYVRSLKMKNDANDRRAIGFALEDMASVAAMLRCYKMAAMLYGAGYAAMKAAKAIPMPYSEDFHQQYRFLVRRALGEPAYLQAHAKGQTQNMIEQAVEWATSPPTPTHRSGS